MLHIQAIGMPPEVYCLTLYGSLIAVSVVHGAGYSTSHIIHNGLLDPINV